MQWDVWERVSIRKRGVGRIIVRPHPLPRRECQEMERVARVVLGSTRPALAPPHSVRQDEENGDAPARLSLDHEAIAIAANPPSHA
jgi:hypothetical protein